MSLHLSLQSAKPDTTYQINDSPISLVPHYCDLGITVDSNLTFSEHYVKICAKAYRMFSFIRRQIFTNHTPLNLKRSLYLTIVRSNLTYCSQVWHPRLIKDIKSLEQVQRRVTRYIISDQTLDYKTWLASLSILPFMYILL